MGDIQAQLAWMNQQQPNVAENRDPRPSRSGDDNELGRPPADGYPISGNDQPRDTPSERTLVGPGLINRTRV